MQALSKWCNIF